MDLLQIWYQQPLCRIMIFGMTFDFDMTFAMIVYM